MYDADDQEVSKDEVRVVLNVDRKPGEKYDIPRNYVQVMEKKANLEGLEASLEGSKPLISWDPTPRFNTLVAFWISIQDNGGAHSLQTGVEKIRDIAGNEHEDVYYEFAPDWVAYENGTDPTGYRYFRKIGSTWTNGKFKVEITDRATGKAEAFFNGTSWQIANDNRMKTAVFENYQIGAELMQSVSRIPGTPSNHAKISEAKYMDNTGWYSTDFAASDIIIYVYDGKGNEETKTVEGGAKSATLFDFNFEWKSGQSYEMWDSRTW